ncbi:hypothetical protein [Chlamydiifrater volucris]|uniref:hypothetical protein n=1 Tax=Chlamydiifrater volucris TaxID=2681470 RepID=UPI0032B234A7
MMRALSVSQTIKVLFFSWLLSISAMLLSGFFFRCLGNLALGVSLGVHGSLILASALASTLILLFFGSVYICALGPCFHRKPLSIELQKDKAATPSLSFCQKLRGLFCRRQEKFSSEKRQLQLLVAIEEKKTIAEKAKISEVVIQEGGFVKQHIKDLLDQFSNEEKLAISFPCFALSKLREDVCRYDFWPEAEFLGSERTQKDLNNTLLQRFFREFFLVSSGVFSHGEMVAITKEVLGWGSEKDKSRAGSSERYAKLILTFPKVVAFEAVFLNWLKRVFPYATGFDFDWYQKNYLYEGLGSTFPVFEDETTETLVLEKRDDPFSGVVRVSLALFYKERDSNAALDIKMPWKSFCEKAMKYGRKTCFDESYSGDLRKFQEFLVDEDRFFSSMQQPSSPVEEGGFIKTPRNIWNIGALCEQYPSLKQKIEEGLRELENIECLGGSLEDLVELEYEVLGLSRDRI